MLFKSHIEVMNDMTDEEIEQHTIVAVFVEGEDAKNIGVSVSMNIDIPSEERKAVSDNLVLPLIKCLMKPQHVGELACLFVPRLIAEGVPLFVFYTDKDDCLYFDSPFVSALQSDMAFVKKATETAKAIAKAYGLKTE